MKGFLIAQASLRCNDRTFTRTLQVVPPTETVDAFGYAINYFSGDYRAIGGNQSFEVNKYNSNFENNSHNLYNGNIKQITMALMTPCGERLPELGTNYYYDQLNRIKSSVVYYGGYFFQQSYLSWEGISVSSDYYTSYDYDPNGNITRLVRNGYANSGQLNMDNLVYHYDPGTNRLLQVNDAISSTNYSTDIDNQTSSTNYHYDHSGNLIEDESEGISTSWNVYGKVKQVQKTDGTIINFAYDATGNRIKKQVKHSSDSIENYYVRDAQGNVMAMYELRRDTFWLTEQDLYGSSRLGVKQYWIPLNFTTFDTTRSTELLGFKQYELTNHLGNVEVTVSDRRIPHLDIDSNIIYYDPDVRTMADYYPFGMEMPGRVANLLDVYSVTDTVSTPVNLSIYGNNPYTSTANMAFTLPTAIGSFDFSINLDMTSFVGDILVTIRDDQNNPVFTCTAHSSQVIYQVTASRVPVTCTDYTATAEPLGMYTGSFVIQFSPVLHYTTRLDWVCSTSQSINYRYGFNGKEKINEVYGEGNFQNYGMRIYDTRICRFPSIDPITKKYPELTPYQFASNTPIWGIDLDGLEVYYSTNGTRLGQIGKNTQVRSVNADNIYAMYYVQAAIIQSKDPKSFKMAEFMAISFTNKTPYHEAELRMAAFLSTIRQAENSSTSNIGEPLKYNDAYGGNKIKDLSKYPNETYTAPDGSKSAAAGAYEIMPESWNTINNVKKQNGYYGENQDKGAIILIKEQDKWNPDAKGVYNDIISGKCGEAAEKLSGSWTSLPGGSQQKMTKQQFQNENKNNISKILKGESIIATPPNKLLK